VEAFVAATRVPSSPNWPSNSNRARWATTVNLDWRAFRY